MSWLHDKLDRTFEHRTADEVMALTGVIDAFLSALVVLKFPAAAGSVPDRPAKAAS